MRSRFTLAVALLLAFAPRAEAAPSPVPQAPASDLQITRIPPRSASAMSGSAFYQLVKDMTQTQREVRIVQELSSGNVPGFERAFRPVTVQAVIGGQMRRGTFYVMPDYLAIGSNADFFRMPMRPLTAQGLLDQFGCLMPTRRMVNAIWTAASVKLAPYPLSPATYDITHVTTFKYHHDIIELQRYPNPVGPATGGIKKDVVITPLLLTNPGKVAIYGWHQLNGVPIQPLYLGHGDYHVDYSHGIRPVWGQMTVDGVWRTVASVLADPALCVLLSDEGVVTRPRYQ
jgi:hypothetical protein